MLRKKPTGKFALPNICLFPRSLALASLAARLSKKFAQRDLKPCSGFAQCFEKNQQGSSPCWFFSLIFLLPERFDLTYVGEDGQQHRPVVVHRGVVSTMERFVAFLLEEYKGAFPTWLAPIQTQIIPVSNDVHLDYAKKVQESLQAVGVRVEIDERDEKLGYKIREAQMQKIPYMLVLGDKEMEASAVNIRKYGEQDSESVSLEQFVEQMKTEARK